jgi:hypoxanthine phosphoribosyltransferase
LLIRSFLGARKLEAHATSVAISNFKIRQSTSESAASKAFNHAPARYLSVKVLINEQRIQEGVRSLASSIEQAYQGRPLTIVGLMTGSIVLLADLIRLLKMPLRVGVLQASSYRNGTQRQDLQVNSELMLEITHRDVLVIDDILDTGHTLCEVLQRLQQLKPNSIRSAVLLRKLGRQEVALQPDFVVFEIPNQFVVGYGLDYCDQYRNLPYVAALEPADMGTV